MSNVVPPHLKQDTAPAGNQTQAPAGFEQQVLELKRRQRELDQRERSLNGAMTREQIAAELKKDKANFLKGFGVELPESQEEVPDHIRELRELKASIEKEKADKAREEYRNELLGKVKGNDQFELLNSLGDYDFVLDHIEKLKASGEEFDPMEIFSQVEGATYAQFEKAKSAKKLQSWFEASKPETAPIVKPGNQSHPLDANRTITSNDRPSTSSSDAPSRPLSRAESLARVAAKYGSQNNPQGN
jgi:hypothetical protein